MTTDKSDKEDYDRANKDHFLYPRGRYHGKFSPEALVFNANLQEFAQRVSIICNLETGGKLPPGDAYEQIRCLWQTLKHSKKELIDSADPPDYPSESDSSA